MRVKSKLFDEIMELIFYINYSLLLCCKLLIIINFRNNATKSRFDFDKNNEKVVEFDDFESRDSFVVIFKIINICLK